MRQAALKPSTLNPLTRNQQHSRFYSRNSGGKYALDVFELRQAFLGSGSLSERAREFRAERLGRLLAGEVPVNLTSASLVCVHVIPHAALAGAVDIDFQLVESQIDTLRPLFASSCSSTFNLDGFMTYSPRADGTNGAYLQLFRNGVIESVNSTMLRADNEHRAFPSLGFPETLAEFVGRARRFMRQVTMDPPGSIFVSLLGFRGTVLGISEKLGFYQGLRARAFDRDNILFREVPLVEWDGDVLQTLRPLHDELWQATGFSRCLNYDVDGNWDPIR